MMSEENTLTSLVNLLTDNKLAGMHAGLPAKIVKYDPTTQKATVQPIIKYRDRSWENDPNGLKDMPVIQNIPVIHPSAGSAIVSFPVKVGDIVALMFSSKSIDTFLLSDGSSTIDPQDNRMYHQDDCYAVLGLYPFSKALGSHPSDLEVRMNSGTGNECKVALKPNGDVVITSPTKVIVNATDEVIVNTATATVNASDSVTIDSPQTTCTGELRVDGGVSVGSDVETDAGFSANTHKHVGNLGKITSSFVA
jgi:Phage protein Gp138 N-terminal domain/Phage spike trimer